MNIDGKKLVGVIGGKVGWVSEEDLAALQARNPFIVCNLMLDEVAVATSHVFASTREWDSSMQKALEAITAVPCAVKIERVKDTRKGAVYRPLPVYSPQPGPQDKLMRE